MKSKDKRVVSCNKLLYEIFNLKYDESQIKVNEANFVLETVKQEDGATITEKVKKPIYYIEFQYKESKGNISRVKLSSFDKEKLKFTIEEVLVYLILITAACQSNNDNDYFISMRKLKELRGLDSNSSSTYRKYENALERLCAKEITVSPYKTTYKKERINCKLLELKEKEYSRGRLSGFTYSFNNLDTTLVKSRQRTTVGYNLFSQSLKKGFTIQASLYLVRMIFMNKRKYENRNFSFQRLLMKTNVVDSKGVIQNESYYQYLSMKPNKRAETLNKMYQEVEEVLKNLKNNNNICDYSISKNRSYKYIRDDEVKIYIKFIKDP